ncbi:Eisosomes component [Clarireedia jacksonii]
MAMMRSIMGLTSLILIAASIVFIFFVVLSGVSNTTPLNKTYFLRADTSSISGARSVSQWTYFYICGQGNTDCGKPVPALPFGYAWLGGGQGAPSSLLGQHAKGTTSKHFYYLWRFGWVFYLMGLVFDVVAFFASLLAPCSRLASYFASSILVFALFWFSLGASLMTAEFVQARNRFRSDGINASVGRWAFGWTWAAWAAMFLATITLCLGGALGGEGRRQRRRDSRIHTEPAGTGRRGGFNFYRNQRKRERGSFAENESQRRVVKDDYA